ncbi:unnamed protein product [Nesidiocoris tenuis]|uniref:Uncharacterized protein n=1 Tax=Nesidiocoris tenuis TaxID=355587 RepID=A0A6H5FVP1_9HEMI|nr:unnamed protein product [Nesidiocoris tenuis]
MYYLRATGFGYILYRENKKGLGSCWPPAIVVVAASPLNIVVPLASHLLGPEFSNRVLGSTCHDTLRASRLLNSLIGERYQTHRLHVLPVIGGATPTTRLPLFSQIYPQICMTDVCFLVIIFHLKSEGSPKFSFEGRNNQDISKQN